MVSGVKTWVIRWSNSKRFKPAWAKTIASKFSVSNFLRRVCTLPRKTWMSKSGRACKSWAWRRREEVPTLAPWGSLSRVWYRGDTRASKGISRWVMAPKISPCGRSVGISLRLCTAISIAPLCIASSSSAVKRPLPPISARDFSNILSPLVLKWTISTSRLG